MKVNFSTPVFDDKYPWFSAVEGYFDVTGRRARVQSLVRPADNGAQWVQSIQQKLPWYNVALKVASYITVVGPLFVLLAKIAFRCWNSSYAYLTKAELAAQVQHAETELGYRRWQVKDKDNEGKILEQSKILINLKKSRQKNPASHEIVVDSQRPTQSVLETKPRSALQKGLKTLKDLRQKIASTNRRLGRQRQILSDLKQAIWKEKVDLRPTLVESEDPARFSRDVFSAICSFLTPEEVALSATRVNRHWRDAINHSDQRVWKQQAKIQGLIPPKNILYKDLFKPEGIHFGRRNWQTYFGIDVKDAAPHPPSINGVKWTLIPRGMSLNILAALAARPNEGYNEGYTSGYSYFGQDMVAAAHGDTVVAVSYWVAMTPTILKGTRNQNFDQQQETLRDYNRQHRTNYRVPKAIEIAVINVAEYVRSRQYVFGSDPYIFPYCQETMHYQGNLFRVFTGGFGAANLHVNKGFGDKNVGLSGLQEE